MKKKQSVTSFTGTMEEATWFPQEATLTGTQFGLAALSREIVSETGCTK